MIRRSILLALALTLCSASTAFAGASMQVGVADDRILFGEQGYAASTVNEWAAKGVDVVRIIARWGAYAPSPGSRSAPAGFAAADPSDPRYDWGALDRAVGLVEGAGMDVALTVTGWGPVWGSQYPVKRNPRWKPHPQRFAAFATAVARRYGAVVDTYVLFNEPNQAQWLQPQSECTSSRRCSPYAPHHYRRLVRAAGPAIRRADPGARIAVGALAPRGTSGRSANAALKPLVFLRAFGCVNAKYRKTRRKLCRGFKPATADLLAHHPHSLKLAPSAHDRDRDNASLGDLSRLTRAIDRIKRARGLKVRGASRIPLYLDEYAYQTRPPDKVLGVSPSAQSRWLQQGAAIAAANRRVRALVWYVWRDEPMGRFGTGWQSGLHYEDGRAKPALADFARPFWASKVRKGVVRLWGQVRPGAAHAVTIERRSGGSWRRYRSLTTDRYGGFTRTVRIARRTSFRFRYDGGVSDSRTVKP
jgi:hypothetical protein